MRLPGRPFAGALLGRAAVFWAGCRLLVPLAVAVFSGSLTARDITEPRPALAPIVGCLGLIEARRRNEHIFLANLGVAQPAIALVSAAPALAGELAIAALSLG